MALKNKTSAMLRLFCILLFAQAGKAHSQIFLNVFPVFQIGAQNFQKTPLNREFYLNYLQDPRLIQAGFDFAAGDFDFYMRFEMFKNLKGAQNGATFSNFFSVDKGISFAGFNSSFPSQGWANYHNWFLDISLGRRKLSEGYGKYGFTVKTQAPSLDALWISVDPLKQAAVRPFGLIVFASSDQKANQDFLDVHQIYSYKEIETVDENGSVIISKVPIARYGANNKWFLMHKIGLAGDFFRIGLTESFMIYGENLSLGLVNPFTLWHNSYLGNANAGLALNAEFLTPPGIRVYGEWFLDDMNIGEFDDPDKPTAMGFMLGADWQIFSASSPYIGEEFGDEYLAKTEESFAKEGGLIVGFEAVYSSRYMYGRAKGDPFGKFSFFTTTQYGSNEFWPLIEYYLGFPYGAQAALLEARASYKEGRWNVQASLGYLAEGEKDSGVYDSRTPAGMNLQDTIPDNATGDWRVFEGKPTHSLLLNAQAYWAYSPSLAFFSGLSCRFNFTNANKSFSSFQLGLAYKAKGAWLQKARNHKQAQEDISA